MTDDQLAICKAEAEVIYRSAWAAAINRCGGFLERWQGIIDWQRVRVEEFERFWVEHTKVYEAERDIASQQIAHKMAQLQGSPLFIPTEIQGQI